MYKWDIKKYYKEEWFHNVRLLTTDAFISYCKDRGLRITKEELELLEKYRLFFPVMRIKYPFYKVKIRYIENKTKYIREGMLKSGEKWKGATKKELYATPSSGKVGNKWFKDGHIWSPIDKRFRKWATFPKFEYQPQIQSFYSIFQILPLHWFHNYYYSRINILKYFKKAKTVFRFKFHKGIIRNNQEKELNWERVAFLCQALSNRYYPSTQTDQRSITVSQREGWDWNEYSQSFSPHKIRRFFKLRKEELKDIHYRLLLLGKQYDPLERWTELTQFISVTKKENMKGDALYAQTIYCMCELIRFFYKDLYNDDLEKPSEFDIKRMEEFYGINHREETMEYFKYILTEYNLNIKPNAIILVEGASEEEFIKRIYEKYFGIRMDILGIELYNLRGIGEATKLHWFIDYHHSKQTFVFLILDNENESRAIARDLKSQKSKIGDIREYIIPEDNITIWDKCFEFDNFTNNELALALTSLCKNRYTFTSAEIITSRGLFLREGNPLELLYLSKTGKSLRKTALAKILADQIINNTNPRRNFKRKKIIRLLIKFHINAITNHQPTSKQISKWNLRTRKFG